MIAIIFFPWAGLTQDSETLTGDDVDVIQLELDRAAPELPEMIKETVRSDVSDQEPKVDFSTLGTLAPFKEISIVQRKFLPKTGRFQLNGSLGTVTNDPFFNTVSLGARTGYFFSEAWGIEADYISMSTSQRQVTKNIRNVKDVITDSLISIKSYLGVHLVFVPFYGKMTFKNRSIIPFDFYFSAGYGSTRVQSSVGEENPGTYHLGVGQIFSVSKSFAIRWDFTANVFSATGLDGNKQQFNNLIFGLGGSFFLPEASYR
jgi:outer membrane beta-barrel protein